MNNNAPLLQFDNVSKIYRKNNSDVSALQDFSMSMSSETPSIMTIAGESGCGKSTIAQLALGMVQPSVGNIQFRGENLVQLRKQNPNKFFRQVQAIFQDPFNVYNPYYKISHVFDTIFKNFGLARTKTQFQRMTEEALDLVGLSAARILNRYPHELSGGQRQRLMFARCYLIKPKLIVADEPVSMIDASLRASVLDLMKKLRDEAGISFLYITHDLVTAKRLGDSMMILYQGRLAERGYTNQVISKPMHPYSQLLIDSIPNVDPDKKWSPMALIDGTEKFRFSGSKTCRFSGRCPNELDICSEQVPPIKEVDKTREVACFLYSN